MMPPSSSKSYNEFERESRRIDELVWAAMAIAPKSRVLFLGFENSREVIARALRDDVHVTVIESNPVVIRETENLNIEVVRASSSGLPFRADTFDVAVAHYYLHETDPSFHGQISFEMSRVARRIAVVEPGPPADLLGSRIAGLYARAKRDLGQFEHYQSVDYWRKMLASVRSVVVPMTISYGALPPRAFLRDTMRMMLDLMRIGGVSNSDLAEMRALANASDVQMLPQPRYVLLAANTLAEIPDRPRVGDLEELAPNRLRERRAEDERIARRTQPGRLPKIAATQAPLPVERISPVETIAPFGENRRPVAQSFVSPSIVEAVAPTAARSKPAAAAFGSQLAFDVPAIPAGDEPVEDLFKKRPASGSRANVDTSNWNRNEPAEMPDFGLPQR